MDIYAQLDDYVIVKESSGGKIRYDLFKVIKLQKNDEFMMKRVSERQALEGFEAIDYTLMSDDLDVEVVANLGTKLPKTNYPILNVKMNALIEQFYVNDWGNVFWFLPKSNDGLKNEITDILEACVKELAEVNVLELFPFQTHVMERFDGIKEAGTYSVYKKLPFDSIHLYVSPSVDNGGLQPTTVYHEYAHGLWHHCIPNSIKMKWYRYYINACNAALIPEKSMLGIAKEFAAAQSIKDFKSEHKDDEAYIKAIQGFIRIAKSYHNLTAKDLDLMLDSGEDIYPLIVKNDRTPIGGKVSVDTKVSEYANTNTVEMYCESFAAFMDRKELPPEIEDLISETLEMLEPRDIKD